MKRNRVLSVFLALTLSISALAACTKKPEATPTPAPTPSAAPSAAASATPTPTATPEPAPVSDVPDYMNEFGYPIAKEPTTFSALLKLDSQDGRWEDLELMQWLEELTNVKWEYEVVETDDQYREQASLLLASNRYPDVLFPRAWAIRWYEDEAYGKEGFLIDHKPLLERWMPNAQNFFEKYPVPKAGQTAGNGAMYGLPYYYEGGVGGNPHNWYMEPYWSEVAGWEGDVPYTVDEMRQFMYDIKAVMDSGDYYRPEDDMYVLGWQNNYGDGPMVNVMLAAYTGALCSIGEPWAVPDGKTVELMVNHPGYRKTLEFFNEMFTNGLIDPDLFTAEPATIAARKNQCKYAMFSGSSSSLIPELVRSNPEVHGGTIDPEKGYGCLSIRPMTSEYNDTPRVGYETVGTINQMMITDKCKQPEVIARWADIFYNLNYDVTDNSVPNPLMFFLGRYGEHWEYTNEERTKWTFLDRPDGGTNEDGTTKINWMYSRNYLVPGWSLPAGGYIFNTFAEGTPLYIAKQVTNVSNQYPYTTNDTRFPSLARMSDEESDSVSTQIAEIQEYQRQQWGMFMSGQQEINDANWDAYLNNLKTMGIDDVIAVYQQVYDRWVAALQ